MTKRTNSYDEMKGFLNNMRNLTESIAKKKSLTEQETPQMQQQQQGVNPNREQFDDVEVINDVEIKLASPDREDVALRDNEKQEVSKLIDTFRQQVSQIAEFEPGITISETQIRLDGSISDYDLNFVFIAGDNMGFYLNADMLKVEDEVVEVIRKLSLFTESFRSTMEPLIRDRKTS